MLLPVHCNYLLGHVVISVSLHMVICTFMKNCVYSVRNPYVRTFRLFCLFSKQQLSFSFLVFMSVAHGSHVTEGKKKKGEGEKILNLQTQKCYSCRSKFH